MLEQLGHSTEEPISEKDISISFPQCSQFIDIGSSPKSLSRFLDITTHPFKNIKLEVRAMQELPIHCVNLKAFRTSLNMSQVKIAVKLGITQSTYWQIENGVINPSYKFLKRLANSFPNVNLNELLFKRGYSSCICNITALENNVK